MKSKSTDATDGIPLPAALAAVWGAFLFEGLLTDHANQHHCDAVLRTWGKGVIELVIASTLFLPEVWRQVSEYWEQQGSDMPGVFEYEVISPFGIFIANYLLTHNGTLPSADCAAAEIHRLITVFFHQTESPPIRHVG